MEKEEILKLLNENPQVQQYLSHFSESSAKHFLENYAATKSIVLTYRNQFEESETDNDTNFQETAEEFYWLIAQKKLFNLQCLWRAGQIDLPGIKICADFNYWEHNISACSFLDDITVEEIDLMGKYLEQTDYEEVDYICDIRWQDYEEFKEDNDTYPEWYEIYDGLLGTGALLSLPDVRGPLEEKYLKAWRQETIGKSTQPHKTDERPEIAYFDWGAMSKFVRATEGASMYTLFEHYFQRQDFHRFEDEISESMQILYNEPGEVLLEEGPFPQVIYKAAYTIKIRKVIALMHQIHTDDMARKGLGIGYDADPYEKSLSHTIRGWLIRGRELLGEPGDLEF